MDPTITLGDVVSIAAFFVSGAAVYTRLSERLKELEVKVGDLWDRRSFPRDE